MPNETLGRYGRIIDRWGKYRGGDRTEILIAAKVLTWDDNNKVFFLNLAAGFTITLPQIVVAKIGFTVEFIVKTAPSGGTYVITEDARYDTDILVVNGINELEVDDTEDGPYSAGCTTITFADGVAVAGDRIKVQCDGVKFYCTGQTNADGGITLA